DDHRLFTEAFRNAIVDGDPFELEFRLERPGERNGWIVAKGKLLGAEKNERARLVGLFGDITPRKLWEALSASHSRIIGMIAKGSSLGTNLDEALRFVETESPPMVCSVLLLAPDGLHARHASAPSLPEDY